MRRVLAVLLVLVLCAAFPFQAYSGTSSREQQAPTVTIYLYENDPYMVVNEKKVEIDPGRGTVPFSEKNRVMVPIRAIVECLGGAVEWDVETAKTVLTLDNQRVELWTGKCEISVNGVLMPMDVAPVSRGNRNFVPVRFVAESFGCDVEWQRELARVKISYCRDISVDPIPAASPVLKADGANIMGFDIEAGAGEKVYYKFFAYDLEELGRFDFKVEYDPSKITAVSVVKGVVKESDYISSVDLDHAGQGFVTVRSDDVMPIVQDNGVLFAVVFNIASDASGSVSVRLSGKMYGVDGEFMEPLHIEEGAITINNR